MSHGSIAFIKSSSLYLSGDLLGPLAILPNCAVTGLYYPRPLRYESAGSSSLVEHDLMLTSIPYRAWPTSLRLTVSLRHRKGTMAAVAEFLARTHRNILHAQCTRAGHRYAVWQMIIEVEGLVGDDTSDVGYSDLRKITDSWPTEIEGLEQELREQFKEHIMPSKGDPYLPRSIRCEPLRALAYFFSEAQFGGGRNVLLNFKSVDGQTLIPEGLKETQVLEQWRSPALGFARLDTEEFNIRVAIVTQDNIDRFRVLTIPYEQKKTPRVRTSRGLTSDVTSILRKDWNLWHVYQQVHADTLLEERGTVRIFMESRFRQAGRIEKSVRQAEDVLGSSLSRYGALAQILPISPRRLFLSIKDDEELSCRGGLVEAVEKEAPRFGIFPQNVVTVQTNTRGVTTRIFKDIESCNCFLQFYMGSGDRSWLNAEYFLARYRDLATVRVVERGGAEPVVDKERMPIKVSLAEIERDPLEIVRAALEALDRDLKRKHPRPALSDYRFYDG